VKGRKTMEDMQIQVTRVDTGEAIRLNEGIFLPAHFKRGECGALLDSPYV
jgi:hypothetical protein